MQLSFRSGWRFGMLWKTVLGSLISQKALASFTVCSQRYAHSWMK